MAILITHKGFAVVALVFFYALYFITFLSNSCHLVGHSNEELVMVKLLTESKEVAKPFHRPPLPSNCTKVAFDIGVNNGMDTLNYLKQGYCVIGVDANPLMIEEAEGLFRKEGVFDPNRVILLPVGMSEATSTNPNEKIPFYVTRSRVHSSFEMSKARRHDRNFTTVLVDVRPCESLFTLLPDDVRPEFMKVDIEERHYFCIEALARVPNKQLPSYISWEIHEHARDLQFPILDTDLIIKSFYLGYEKLKVVGNNYVPGHGSFSGEALPEDVIDKATQSANWLKVHEVLDRGIPNPRRQKGDWYDYYMKHKTAEE